MAIDIDAKLQKQLDAIRATMPKLEDYRKANEEKRQEMLKDLPLASLIDMAFQQREERKALDKQIKEMNALFEQMEFGIVQRMEEQSDEGCLHRFALPCAVRCRIPSVRTEHSFL